MDPPQRERIHDDLKGIVKGELLFDDLSRVLYSTDASLFEVAAARRRRAARRGGRAAPWSATPARTRCRSCRAAPAPAWPASRSAPGSSSISAGTSAPSSTSAPTRVRVQPGVVYRDLTRGWPQSAGASPPTRPRRMHRRRHAGHQRLRRARAFRTATRATTSPRCASCSTTATPSTVGRRRRAGPPAERRRTGRLEDIVSSVVTLLEQNADLIRDLPAAHAASTAAATCCTTSSTTDTSTWPGCSSAPRGRSPCSPRRRCAPCRCPAGRAVVLLGFASLDAALRAARLALAERPDGLRADRPPAAAPGARQRRRPWPRWSRAAAEAVLLVEYEADTPGARRAAPPLDLADRLHRGERLALLARVAADDAGDRAPLAGARGGAARACTACAARPSRWPSSRTSACRPSAAGLPAPRAGRAAAARDDGVVPHPRRDGAGPHAAVPRPAPAATTRPGCGRWPTRSTTLVLELGGTISTQHGTGLARTPWVGRQYGRLYPGLPRAQGDLRPAPPVQPRQDRRPGAGAAVLAAAQRPELASRRRDSASTGTSAELRLARATLDAGELRARARSCNGCGHCRTEAPAQRMCPIFRATHDEAATPRAKANLMRHLLAAGHRPARCCRPTRCGPSPTCASIARCAPASARPTSTSRG